MEETKGEVALCEVEAGLWRRQGLEGSSIMAVEEGGVEVLECHVACGAVCGRGGQRAQATQWGRHRQWGGCERCGSPMDEVSSASDLDAKT